MSNLAHHTLNIRALRLLLLLTIGISFFFNIHAIPLFDLDEGAFSEATREMLARGDFISTFLDGAPRFDKPILIYWLQALSVSTFGLNEFALRLPSALAAMFWCLAVLTFTWRIKDERHGLLAALVMACSFEVSVMGSAATADALLNLFIAGSMFSIFLYWRERRAAWLHLCFALIGLGFLTKGPVAVLIPLAVSFIFFALKRELKFWLSAVFNPLGLAIFLAIAAPWYIAQYLKEGDAFIQGFFFKHNIDRFHSPMEKHDGSYFYYIPVVLLAVLPFTSLMLRVLSRTRQLVKSDFGLFAILWFGFVLVFFSLSGTKLPHYVLYGLSGLFILMGCSLDRLHWRFWQFLPALLWFALLLGLPEILQWAEPRLDDPFAVEMLQGAADTFGLGYRLFFAGACLLVLVCMAEPWITPGDKLLVVGLVSAAGISFLLLPAVGEVKQAPIKEAAEYAIQHDLKPVRWMLNTPSFSVYTQQVMESREPLPGEVALTKSKYLPELAKYELLYQRNGISLVRFLE